MRALPVEPCRSRTFLARMLCLGLLAGLCLAVMAAAPVGASAAGYAPVAAYSFDAGEGTIVEDVTGDGNTGTVEGASWARGHYGDAMRFVQNEGRQCVGVPDSPALRLEEEFTLEAWVRPEQWLGSSSIISKELEPESGQSFSLGIGFTKYGRVEGWSENEVVYSPGTIEEGTWTHVAYTYDGDHARLYLNGELVSEKAVGPRDLASTGVLRIGCDAEDLGAQFFGRIDEVRIYDRSLSQAEVDGDMEAPLETPKSGPVAEYSFDEGTGTTAEDATGHGHTATIEGAGWARGRYGSGLEFDGGEDCVKVPVDEELQATEEFTVEAWVRPEGSGEEALPVISMLDEGSPGEEAPYAYQLLAGQDEVPKAWVRRGGESGFRGVYGEEPLPERSWSQLTLTDDGSKLRLYVDGKLGVEERSTDVAPPLTEAEGPLEIGCGAFGAHFRGRIDEVRIYDRALTTGEVGSDMEAPIETPKQGPVAAYSFDEGTGSTVSDVTGDGHTATIEDGEWTTHGKYGSAINFDGHGGDRCVSVPDSPELRLSEEFTLEAWVRSDTSPFEDPVLVKESGGADAFGLGLGSRVYGKAEGFIGEGSGSAAAVGGEEIREYEWVHLATTWDGSRIRLYADGELVATEAATTPPATGEGALKIGCDGPDGQFTGRIDEVRVYNRALDGAEVGADMEAPIQTSKATPVAAYSFDEKNEETATDTTGDGHTATVEGAGWTEHGRYGGALEFDAAKKDVLRIPASPELDFSEEFTLEAWVRPSGAENKEAPLIDKQEGAGVGYFLDEGGTVSDRPVGAVEPGQEYVEAEEALPAHAWSHVALTFDGDRTWLYVDGRPVDNGAAEPVVTSEGELEIGGSTATTEFFDGRIDEVRIYNRALNGAEVAADMEAPIQSPKQGPIAAWSFDEGEGTTAEDWTGGGHEGIIEGAEWARGKYGDSLEFDGEDDLVKVPNSPEFDLTEGFTLEAWVRPESASDEWAPILAKGMGGGKAAEELAWWLDESGSESNVPSGGNGPTAGKEEEAIAEDPLPVDVWSHLALTYDGYQLRLYVDGELVDCSAVPAHAPPVTEGELQIGAATEHGDHFKGRIDEVRIYNRALTEQEIKADLGPHDMTAAAVTSNEGYRTEAVAELTYPKGGDQEHRSIPRILLSIATLGPIPEEESTMGFEAFTSSGVVHGRPYLYHWCPYDPGATEVTGPEGHEKVLEGLGDEERELKLLVKSASKTGCPDNQNSWHWRYTVEVSGHISYLSGKWIEPEGPPECSAVPAPEVQKEEAEDRKKEEENGGKHIERHLTNYKPVRREGCFNSTLRGTKATNGLDAIGRWVWEPGNYIDFGAPWYEHEAACGKLDGHIPINVPNEKEEFGEVIHLKEHFFLFHSGTKNNEPRACDWAQPQNPEEQVTHY
jgi:hypothetical protein